MIVPDGWPPVAGRQFSVARTAAIKALAETGRRPVSRRLGAYYDRTTDGPGTLFTELGPNDPRDIDVSDLFATSLVSPRIGPAAARALLAEGEPRARVLAALAVLVDQFTTYLPNADPDGLIAMEEFLAALRAAMASSGRPGSATVAGALAARKLPNLFPLPDRLVGSALGITGRGVGARRTDWVLQRALLGDPDVRTSLLAAQYSLNGRDAGTSVERYELRLFDVAVSTYQHGRIG